MLAASVISFQIARAQRSAPKNVSKGPRALALVEVPLKGKAHLVPVTIVVDGKFYDASAYKAAPVPMALEYGTVYETFRAGISQGFFTVSGALHGDAAWRGEGKWQSAAEIKSAADVKAAKKAAAGSKKPSEEAEGRPTLKRSSPEKSNDTQPSSEKSAAPESTPTSEKTPLKASTESPAVADDQEPVDPNRPALRRGIPPATRPEQANRATDALAKSQSTEKAAVPANTKVEAGIQIFPAISDAGGPETHSYSYDLKPDEEAKFRKKMLAMAADAVREREKQLNHASASAPSRSGGKSAKAVIALQPNFEDVNFRMLDISSSNEPVLVLTARASLPSLQAKGSTKSLREYVVTLVARDDIYAELHKAFANVADSDHLDAIPQLEFIDAVDADGDGRAELLFRQVSEAGSAFSIYRVIGNQLWPLFQGSPGR